MADPEVTLRQVVDYCEGRELLMRLLGIPESEIIRHHSTERSKLEKDNRRKNIDDQTRRAIDELVRVGILREEVQQDRRSLFPGKLWKDRLAMLEARDEPPHQTKTPTE